jgi:short-subunit dehydrogenase
MVRDTVMRLAYTPPYTPGRVLGLLRAPSLTDALRGRTVLITGASSGIGHSTATKLANAGAHVLLVARKAETLEEVRAEITAAGGSADVHPCDLTDPDAIDGLVADVLAAHGGVDVLINNAGLSIRRSVGQSVERPRDRERVMALNFHGAVNLTLGLLGAMRDRGGGQVINVSTMGVIASPPRFSAYVASKAALDAFSRTLANETRHSGIRVTTVHMPLVRTPMIAPTAAYADAAALTPRQAADLIAEAIRTRPTHVSPRAAMAIHLARTFAPGPFETLMNQAYLASRPLADSEAAGAGRALARRVGRALSIRV